jgi:acyl phosphate:glycerol-3-phosphate acyltransferase
MFPFLLLLVVSYLLGSIPFGYVAGRLVAGIDIRTVGSGNIGATNVGRTLGWGWFALVLACDFAKGCLPAFFAPAFLDLFGTSTVSPVAATLAAGGVTMLGHLWPCWLRFQGGKGVATGLGVVVAAAPLTGWWPLALAIGTFAATVLVTRYVSLGSVLAAIVWGVSQIAVYPEAFSAGALPVVAFSIAGPALVIWRHRANLARLWRGEENKIGRKKATAEDLTPSPEDAKKA